jgi:hypothetical protein
MMGWMAPLRHLGAKLLFDRESRNVGKLFAIVRDEDDARLVAIYEEDFLGVSHGFRPGRGAHDALDADDAPVADPMLQEADQPFLVDLVEQRSVQRGSVRLDAHELDHPAPLVGFVGDQLSKVGGRARKHRTA